MRQFLRSPASVLDPRLLYSGPTAAAAWLNRSSVVSSTSRLMVDCRRAVETWMLPQVSALDVGVIVLGVGDLRREAAFLRGVLNHRRRRVAVTLVDINLEIIEKTLPNTSGDAFPSLRRASKRGGLNIISLPFERMEARTEWLPPAAQRCYLVLGNTLANEIDDAGTLRKLGTLLRVNDVMFIELQLVEESPPSDEELTRRFNEYGDFYRSPLVAMGWDQRDVSVRAHTLSGHTGTLVKVLCRCERPPSATSTRTNLGSGEYCVQIIRKYTVDGVLQLVRTAGLAVGGLYYFPTPTATSIAMVYVAVHTDRT
jgi:hypothetical protein